MKLTKTNVQNTITTLHGNLAMVAKTFGRSRTWLYNYLEKHPDLWKTVTEARETMKDNVESTLYTQALAGNTTAMIFFLKTQAKDRGYVERQETEVSTKDDKPIFIVSHSVEDDDATDKD